jgi:hypothetical protein
MVRVAPGRNAPPLGRSQVVRQRILIPSCGGSNPPAPASQCSRGETYRNRLASRRKPVVHSGDCGHAEHRRALNSVSVWAEPALERPPVSKSQFRTGRSTGMMVRLPCGRRRFANDWLCGLLALRVRTRVVGAGSASLGPGWSGARAAAASDPAAAYPWGSRSRCFTLDRAFRCTSPPTTHASRGHYARRSF